MSPLALAWRSMVRRRGSSIVATLILSLVLLAGAMLGHLLQPNTEAVDELEGTPWHLVVGPKSSSMGLLMDALTLRSPPESVIPLGIRSNLLDNFDVERIRALHVVANYRGSMVVGTDESWLRGAPRRHRPEMVSGRFFEDLEEAVVGARAAARLGLEVGDTVLLRWAPSERLAQAAQRRDHSREAQPSWLPEPVAWAPVPARALWVREVVITGIIDHHGGVEDDLILVDLETTYDHYLVSLREGLLPLVGDEGPISLLLVRLRSSDDIPRMRHLLHERSVAQVVVVEEGIEELREAMAVAELTSRLLRWGTWFLLFLALQLLLHGRHERLRGDLAVLRSLGYRVRSLTLVLLIEGVLVLFAASLLAFSLESLLLSVDGSSEFSALPGFEFSLAAPPFRERVVLYLGAFVLLPLALVFPWARLYCVRAHEYLKGV